MESFSTGIWAVGLTVGVVLLLWLWAWTTRNTGPGGRLMRVKETIRGWLGAIGKDDFINEGERFERQFKELASRLSHVEGGLTHQDRLEDLSIDLRRRLHLLEQSSSQEISGLPPSQPGIPRSLLRLGVRITLSDLIWKELGIVHPQNLTDHQLDTVFQGPFCRNCLRSLVTMDFNEGEKSVRYQCRHCSLSWRVDHTSLTIPLCQFKRELYELLDAEYRKTGTIGLRGEI